MIATIQQIEEPPVRPGDGIRLVGLFSAGVVAIAGHVGEGLGALGPLALLPTLALGVTLCCFLLALPSGSGGGAGLIPVLVFLVLLAPGFMWADDSTMAEHKVAAFSQLVIPLLISVSFLSRRPTDMNYYWRGVFALAVVGLLVAGSELASGVDIGARGSELDSTLNPIAAGRLGATVIIWIIFGGAAVLPKVVRAGLVVLGAAVMLGAASRGPLLALIVTVFLSGLRYKVMRGRLAAAVTVVAIALMAGLGNLVLSESGDRISTGSTAPDASSRPLLWAKSIEAIKVFPEGIGWGQFPVGGKIGAGSDYAHNLILEIALEAGVLAAFGLLLALGYLIRTVWVSKATCGPRHFALLMFWIVTSMFSSNINGNRVLLIAIFGLIAAYRGGEYETLSDRQVQDEELVLQPGEMRAHYG